jgi:hypothetical protein
MTLARQLGWIAASDTKAGFIFAMSTAMLGLLASAAPPYGSWTALGVCLTTVASLLLLAGVGSVVLTIFPRTKGPKLSVIFFGGIVNTGVDGFRSAIQSLTDETYEEDLTQQCHINATYAARKYFWVKVASVLLAVSVIPWLSAAYTLFRDAHIK